MTNSHATTHDRVSAHLSAFLDAAERFPDRMAIDHGGAPVRYAAAAQLVKRLAHALIASGGLPRVLIHLPQCTEAYCAMLAATYAGGFYSTINTAHPADRRSMTFEAFRPQAVVTNRALAAEARARSAGAVIIEVESLGEEAAAHPVGSHRLAYVMFTSGSTGKPKGVLIPNEALSHYVAWARSAMQLEATDRWSQHPNIAFDLSVLDIYGALCTGACLVPLTDPADLLMPAQAIRKHRLTIWNSVPSVLNSMIKSRQMSARNLESLRLLTFCGEPLQEIHLDAIFAARPDVLAQNTYGPTEATVSCTLEPLTAQTYKEACRSSVALGSAIPGMRVDLAGGPNADEGEIVISGPQLADGYLDDPGQTEQRFRSFRRPDGIECLAYYTGDWARLDGGRLYFAGRMDHQVKIRGERVELEDINAALMKCGLGYACSALCNEELHAFFERAEPLPPVSSITAVLSSLLPPHLTPRHFHAAPDLPRNANGKVDMNALRAGVLAQSELR